MEFEKFIVIMDTPPNAYPVAATHAALVVGFEDFLYARDFRCRVFDVRRVEIEK
jgi:hypothetical protein